MTKTMPLVEFAIFAKKSKKLKKFTQEDRNNIGDF